MIALKCGDCIELMKDIPDRSIDLILTDPPYLISKEGGFTVGGSWNNPSDKRLRMTPPKTDFGEWDKKEIDFNTVFKEFYRVLKPSGTLICFFDIWKMQYLKTVAEENKFKQFRLIRWDKTNPVPVNSRLNYLTNASEYALTCVKGGSPTFHSKYNPGIFRYPICSGKERTEHPTQKPVDFMIELLNIHTNEGDLVLDSFMGSGSTGVACKKLNRNFIGIELDENYFNIAKERIENYKYRKELF